LAFPEDRPRHFVDVGFDQLVVLVAQCNHWYEGVLVGAGDLRLQRLFVDVEHVCQPLEGRRGIAVHFGRMQADVDYRAFFDENVSVCAQDTSTRAWGRLCSQPITVLQIRVNDRWIEIDFPQSPGTSEMGLSPVDPRLRIRALTVPTAPRRVPMPLECHGAAVHRNALDTLQNEASLTQPSHKLPITLRISGALPHV